MGVGTNTHTSTHYATSDKRWVNEALSYFGYPMFLGLSATYWWHKHVVLHHPAPNVVGVDSDADLLPWFAITADEVHASSGLRRFYYDHLQFWLFPLALALNCFSIQMAGWKHLIGMLRHSKGRKSAHWIDLGALVIHYAIWIGVPLLLWPLPAVAGFYFYEPSCWGTQCTPSWRLDIFRPRPSVRLRKPGAVRIFSPPRLREQ